MKKFLVSFALAALAIASAKSYTVHLYQTSMFGGTELKPGDYRLEVTDQNAILKSGKQEGHAAVKVETNDAKYNNTTVRLTNGEGKMNIEEIHVGGTKMKLVFNESGSGTSTSPVSGVK